MALIALAFSAPAEAQARFPSYRLTQLVASRIDMDPAELEELEELEELIGRKLCAPVVEMPRLFNEQLRYVIKVHALGTLFKADGPGPHHHAVRPAGYDFDADEVIAAGMERWRADYRAMATERQIVNERRNGTLDFHPKGTPMLRLAGAVALAPAQLVGIAQPGRTRER